MTMAISDPGELSPEKNPAMMELDQVQTPQDPPVSALWCVSTAADLT